MKEENERKGRKEKNKRGREMGFRGVEERGY